MAAVDITVVVDTMAAAGTMAVAVDTTVAAMHTTAAATAMPGAELAMLAAELVMPVAADMLVAADTANLLLRFSVSTGVLIGHTERYAQFVSGLNRPIGFAQEFASQ
jgi:hypothetical protein